MGIIHDILLWNLHVCFSLAIVLNFALIWLIIKKSPKEMRFYSRILLQTAIVDILLVTITELIQFTFFMYQNRVIFHLNGPLAMAFPQTIVQFILLSIWFQIYNISVFGQTVQFIFRYLVMNRDIKISMARYWSMLLAIVLFTCILVALFAIAGYPADDDKRFVENQQLAELISGSPEHHLLLAMNMDTNHPLYNIINCFYFLLNFASYAIIIFCGVKMVKFVRKNTVKSTQLELDRQLTRTMIALAIVPCLAMCCNIAVSLSSPLFEKILLLPTDNTGFDLLFVSVQILANIPSNWIMVLNPLILVIAIKPYRSAVISFLISRTGTQVTPLNPQNDVDGPNASNVRRAAWS